MFPWKEVCVRLVGIMCVDVVPLVVIVVVVKTVSLFLTKTPGEAGVSPASTLHCCPLFAVVAVVCCCGGIAVSVPLPAVGVATKAEFSSFVMLM